MRARLDQALWLYTFEGQRYISLPWVRTLSGKACPGVIPPEAELIELPAGAEVEIEPVKLIHCPGCPICKGSGDCLTYEGAL